LAGCYGSPPCPACRGGSLYKRGARPSSVVQEPGTLVRESVSGRARSSRSWRPTGQRGLRGIMTIQHENPTLARNSRTSFYRNMTPVSSAVWGSAVKEGVRTGAEERHERGGTEEQKEDEGPRCAESAGVAGVRTCVTARTGPQNC